SFKYQVQDDGGTDNGGVNLEPAANAHIITVNVAPVNDPSDGIDHNVPNAVEDTPYTFSASDFPLSDVTDNPSPNTLAAVKIASTPLVGTLTLNGLPVSVGQEILVGDLGGLVYQ